MYGQFNSIYEQNPNYQNFKNNLDNRLKQDNNNFDLVAWQKKQQMEQPRGIIGNANYNAQQNAKYGEGAIAQALNKPAFEMASKYVGGEVNKTSAANPTVGKGLSRLSGADIAGGIGQLGSLGLNFMSVAKSETNSNAEDDMNTASLAVNGLSTGASVGAMVGGPIGAGVGAVVGGLGGLLFGSAQKRKQQRRRVDKELKNDKIAFETASENRERYEAINDYQEQVNRLSKLRSNQLNYFDIKY